MFKGLSERIGSTLDRVKGRGRLSEDNIKETLREVRMALLEADVALPVVKEFISQVRARAVGQEVLKSLTPGQALVKVVNDELVRIMGENREPLNFRGRPPVVILLAGLQGAGKTTSAAKLARHLMEAEKKKVALVSTDVRRPAAIEQLETLSGEIGAGFYRAAEGTAPKKIADQAMDFARKQHADVLIVDTAGRLHIDEELMQEVQDIHAAVEPLETLFVVDAMTGQDAARSAAAFGEALPLTGVILTKADGDARGGAALSVRQVTGKPIKFMGVGEKTDALEPFHPDRVASRILGMGDVLSLVDEVQSKVDKEKADKLGRKLKKGKGFSLNDFRDQLEQMQNMGGVGALLDKLPGAGKLPPGAASQFDDRTISRQVAIINSMTKEERRKPAVINGSRKRRIAQGSGVQVQDVNKLLKQFTQAQKMMRKMGKKGGMKKMMRGLQGKMPPGMGFPGQ
ncbi:signal recognition particle protein [Gammaproteobacteria bacterium AB-CW1]|uniref:Signal recognition particle protein n=1 Tax=Natronospira elongata TaxID=3110268 RepID=A0AAP6JEJ8_9GAMM|nr:signal recognition particle protein [Gammaproteobacteria bacterium AB-CW1]